MEENRMLNHSLTQFTYGGKSHAQSLTHPVYLMPFKPKLAIQNNITQHKQKCLSVPAVTAYIIKWQQTEHECLTFSVISQYLHLLMTVSRALRPMLNILMNMCRVGMPSDHVSALTASSRPAFTRCL